MEYNTSALCDIYLDQVDVVEPMFSNFGGRASFAGQITTLKCFEDNALIRSVLEQDGLGRVLLIDGGGSLRKALIDAEIALLAEDNEWEGIVVYGCVREVDELEDMNLGIQALASIPVGASQEGVEPVVGEWQTYTYTLADLLSAGLDISAIDVVMVFPSWGMGEGAVYRIDNAVIANP